MAFIDKKDNSEYNLNVSTKELGAKSIEIKKICDDILSHLQILKYDIESTNQIWESDSADFFRKTFSDEKNEIDTVQRNMIQQISKLNSIIDLYENTESKLDPDIDSLPDNLL